MYYVWSMYNDWITEASDVALDYDAPPNDTNLGTGGRSLLVYPLTTEEIRRRA
jgi:hypothetical protein